MNYEKLYCPCGRISTVTIVTSEGLKIIRNNVCDTHYFYPGWDEKRDLITSHIEYLARDAKC